MVARAARRPSLDAKPRCACHRSVIHRGLDIDAYAEGVASLAHWPNDRVAVLRRLAISEERWEMAAADFRASMTAEATAGGDALARRFKAAIERARAKLEREQPDLAALAPLRLAAPEPAAWVAPGAGVARTGPVDPEVLRQVLAGPRPPNTAPEPSASATLPLTAPKPYVPAALPFTPPTDEEIEAFASLTADLELFPDQRARVFSKHEVASEEAFERERSAWIRRWESDVRSRMYWEGLHKSLVDFARRQRRRGKEPTL